MTGAYQQGRAVRLRERLAYACGDAGFNFLWVPYDSFLIFYLVDFAHFSSTATMAVIFSGRCTDLAVSVAFGLFGNRFRSRFGTYRPYLFWLTIPMTVAFIGLLAAPVMLHADSWRVSITCVAAIAFAAVYAACNTAYTALLSVIVEDEPTRVRMAGLRFGFAAGTSLLVQYFALPLTKSFSGEDAATGWGWFGMACAGCAALFVFISAAGTRERLVTTQVRLLTPAQMLRDTLRQRRLPLLIAAMIFCLVALSCRGATSPFYIDRVAAHLAWTGPALAANSFAAFFACIAGPALLPRRWLSPLPFVCATAAGGAFLSLLPAFWTPSTRTELLMLQAAFGALTGMLLPTLFALFAEPLESGTSTLTPAFLAALALIALKAGSALGALLVATIQHATGGPTDTHHIVALFAWWPASTFAATSVSLAIAGLGRREGRL